MGVDVGTATGYLDLDISGFLTSLKTAQSEAEAKSSNIATKVGNNLSTAGKKITSAGNSLTKSVTVPVVGIGTAIIKTSADFEAAMSKVSAISGATGDDLDKLNKKAQEMGAKTKFSATESAQAFQYMAMAGWKTEDMLDGIDGIMNLAAADGLDLATTSDIVTDALTAFGLSAKDSGEFADVLAAASSNANTNVSMLGESFKYVAPVAGSLGYSVQDTSVALGLMANSGIKASSAGTALRTMLTNLAKPTDAMAAAMDDLGISLDDGQGNMKSLRQVMDDLRKGFANCKIPQDEFQQGLANLQTRLEEGEITEKQYNEQMDDLINKAYGAEGALKAKAAATIAGKTGMAGLLSIVNTSEEDYQKLTQAVDGASTAFNGQGTAAGMAQTMIDNLSGQVVLLKSALEGLAIQLGDIIMPHIKDFVAKVQELVDKFAALSPEQQEQIIKWALIAAAIGPVLIILGKLISSVGTIVTVFGKLPGAITTVVAGFKNFGVGCQHVVQGISLARAGFPGFAAQASKLGAAIGGITLPMVAIIAVIALLVGAFVTLWNTNEEFRNKITSIWEEIKTTISSFCDGIVERVNALGFDFQNITQVISAIWNGFCALLAPVFTGAFQFISDCITEACGIITGIVDILIGLFTGDWDQLWQGVQEVFGSVWDFVVNCFQNVCSVLTGILDTVCGWFGTTWSDTWNNIKDTFSNIWEGISSFFSNAWDGLVTIVTTVFETIKNAITLAFLTIKLIFTTAFQIITLPFRFIWENCKDIIITVWNAIKEKVTMFVNAVRTVISTVFSAISGIITPIVNQWKNTITTVWNAIKTVVTTVVNAVKSVIGTVFNAIKTVITTIMNAVKSKMTSIWNTIKSIVTTAINAVKNNVKNSMTSVKSTVTSILNSVKDKFTNVFNSIKKFVKEKVDWLKKVFDFKWDLPKIKLPHFSITGSFSLNPPSAPSFGIDWYKKAMDNGMIMNQPTIFGFNAQTGKFLAGGEAGSEVVVGTNSLLSMIKSAVENSSQKIKTHIASYCLVVIDMFKSYNNNIANIITNIADANDEFLGNIAELLNIAQQNSLQQASMAGELLNTNLVGSQTYFNYDKMAEKLLAILKQSPIQPNVEVTMQDGDVYMDTERVGRTLAPVISRVVLN